MRNPLVITVRTGLQLDRAIATFAFDGNRRAAPPSLKGLAP